MRSSVGIAIMLAVVFGFTLHAAVMTFRDLGAVWPIAGAVITLLLARWLEAQLSKEKK